MNSLVKTIKVFGRNEWLYYYYSKITSSLQKYIDDSFEATQIIDKLWLGAISSACNRQALHDHNIELIVTAFLGSTADFPYDFNYERAKLRDVENEDILTDIENLLPIIHRNLVEGKSVLVNCRYGRSRSATIVAAYLIRYRNMGVDEALDFIKNKRSQVNPNDGYIEQLRKFETNLINKTKTE